MTELLKKSDDARVLNACTTNIRHFFEPKRKIDFDNLRGEFKDSRPYNSYKMYGDSKTALLMLTFKMAEQFKKDGIKINATQIPAIKIAKETMAKFKSGWKIAAMAQNIFSSSPESMANTYFQICSSVEFKDITGKLINAKKEIMRPSPYNSGLRQELKQLFDQRVYPKYAANPDHIEKVWDLAVEWTKI